MRVLLINPEDELQDGRWASQRWDRVVDLGRAGVESYDRAAASFGCPVTPLNTLRENFKEMRKVRELLGLGMGRLNDKFGLDWWELTSILVHQQLETVIVLREFVDTLGPLDVVHISRPGFQAEVLRLALGPLVRVFPWQGSRYKRAARHYIQVLKKFPVRQLLEIFWDKTDPGYQFRGAFNGKRMPFSGPLVLLPSGYIIGTKLVALLAPNLKIKNPFLLVGNHVGGGLGRGFFAFG